MFILGTNAGICKTRSVIVHHYSIMCVRLHAVSGPDYGAAHRYTRSWPLWSFGSHVHDEGHTTCSGAYRLLMSDLRLTMQLSWLCSSGQRATLITGLASDWPGSEPRLESEMGQPLGGCWERRIERGLSVISIRVDREMKLNAVSKFNVERVKLLGGPYGTRRVTNCSCYTCSVMAI